MCECQARASTGSAVPALQSSRSITHIHVLGCVGVSFFGKEIQGCIFFLILNFFKISLAYYLGVFEGTELNYSVGFVVQFCLSRW